MRQFKGVDPRTCPDVKEFPKRYGFCAYSNGIPFDYPIWLFKRPADYTGPLGIVKIPANRAEYLLGLTKRTRRGEVTEEPLLAQPLNVGRNNFKPIEDIVMPIFILKSNSTFKTYKNGSQTPADKRIKRMKNIMTAAEKYKPVSKIKTGPKPKPIPAHRNTTPKDKSNE